MCYHTQQTKVAQTLEKRFKAKFKTDEPFQSEHFNGFNYPKTPIIAHNKQDEIQLNHWGLIPAWAKDRSIQQYTLNAKVETLNEKPSFKNNIQNRCLILADGFMEWQWLDVKGKSKQQYLITLPNNDAFAFAGIWSEWLDPTTGEILNTYSILTTEATGLMAEIHNSKKRMPIILTPEQEAAWLIEPNYLDFSHNTIELKAEKIQNVQGSLF
jgi:putative SOS response-associated peptidase YedK